MDSLIYIAFKVNVFNRVSKTLGNILIHFMYLMEKFFKGSTYIEAIRVQIHANVRIRRIYFTDQLHSDEDLPNEFKLFAPGLRDQKTKPKEKKPSKEAIGNQLISFYFWKCKFYPSSL